MSLKKITDFAIIYEFILLNAEAVAVKQTKLSCFLNLMFLQI